MTMIFKTGSFRKWIVDSIAGLSPLVHTHPAADITDFEDAVEGIIDGQKGEANGLAPLDGSGKVAASYLPSYVDDVLEYANYAALPGTGESGKIYVLATPYNGSEQFRWTGSAYAPIIASPGTTDAVTEGSVNLYHTVARVRQSLSGTNRISYNASTGVIDLPARVFNARSSLSFQTVAASANGFQVSATRDAHVAYTVSVTAAVQIGVVSNVGGYAALEMAATNSANAGDWVEIARVGTSQNIGIALALASTQVVTGVLSGFIPAGYYVRVRTVNSNGTPTYSYIGGREVLD